MHFTTAAAALLISASSIPLAAQGYSLVEDVCKLSPLSGSPEANLGHGFVQLGRNWFFTANDGVTGLELWRTDGTTRGTELVADINPGAASSRPGRFAIHNGQVYFTAVTSLGRELWTSDGTMRGTRMVADIAQGSASSEPYELSSLGSRLFFSAETVANGRELWCSDGTAAGTSMFWDFAPGPTSSWPRSFGTNTTGNRLYFSVDSSRGKDFWSTDGSVAGTQLVKADARVGSGVPWGRNGRLFTAWEAATGAELWFTDGRQTRLVADIEPGPGSSNPFLVNSAELGGVLYFAAWTARYGKELWRTDGTAAGTSLVSDINRGSDSASPNELTAAGSYIFFAATQPASGLELWRTDGISTVQVRDIEPGAGNAFPDHLRAYQGGLVFKAQLFPFGSRLWISDGTSAGTRMVSDRVSAPEFLTVQPSGSLLFSARSPLTGEELWSWDGSGPVSLVKDIGVNSQTGDSSPRMLRSADGHALYFMANDGIHGEELWRATSGGASLVKDLEPGPADGPVRGLTTFWGSGQSESVFALTSGAGAGLWRTDGTAAGTTQLLQKNVNPLSATVVNGNRVHFLDRISSYFYRLIVSDGTVGGTFSSLHFASSPPVAFNGGLVGGDYVDFNGNAILWRSTGSIINPTIVRIWLSSFSPIIHLTAFNGRVVFSAGDSTFGVEIWQTDGTKAGTSLLLDCNPGSGSSSPKDFTRVGDLLYFTASIGGGRKLWRTDLTAAGTFQVPDNSGAVISNNLTLTAVGDSIYFPASTTAGGRELYRAGGSSVVVQRVADLNPGSADGINYPGSFLAANGGIYFTGNDGVSGDELWFSEGTAATTVRVFDMAPGSLSSSPADLTVVGGRVYFTAAHPDYGRELFRLDGNPSTIESLGQGCQPFFAELRSTELALGKPAEFRGDGGTAAPGVLLFGTLVPPYALPGVVPLPCAVYPSVFLGYGLLNQPPGANWRYSFTLQNDPTLLGNLLAMQSVYSFPFRLSNAVVARIGQ